MNNPGQIRERKLPMIEVRNLTKYFGAKKVVDSISFQMEKGEILGFLGPNGAGKSTTMRMITGFIPPSGGTAVVGDADIIEDSISARSKIGYLPENAPDTWISVLRSGDSRERNGKSGWQTLWRNAS